MGIDGSGTNKQRNLTELEFGGLHLENGTWSYLVNLQEMPKGGPEMELKMIINTIAHFRGIQDSMKLNGRRVNIIQFESITYDNTAANTGRWSGLGALLGKYRRDQCRGESLPFLRKGCDDHVANLISKHYRRRLGEGQVHVSDTIVRWLSKRCGGHKHRASFRAFCEALGRKPPAVRPIDESRFINFETTLLTIYRDYDLFLLFVLYQWFKVSDKRQHLFQSLCEPEVRAVFAVRAAGCGRILGPYMHTARGFHVASDYSVYLSDLMNRLRGEPVEYLFGYPRSGGYDSAIEQLMDEVYIGCKNVNMSFVQGMINGFSLNRNSPEAFLQSIHKALGTHRSAVVCLPGMSLAHPQLFFGNIARSYLETCVELINKHNLEFIAEAAQAPSQTIVKPTNRSGESQFGCMKNLLRFNPFFRSIVMLALLQNRQFSIEEITKALEQYSQRYSLYTAACKLLQAAPNRKEWNKCYLEADNDRKKSKASPTPNLYIQLVSVVQQEMKMGSTVNLTSLRNLLGESGQNSCSGTVDELLTLSRPIVGAKIAEFILNGSIN